MRATHFLVVSAPFGPFAHELRLALETRGARTSRVILNAGDLLDWGPTSAFSFRGRRDDWSAWLTRLIAREGVTDIICHGDSRPYDVDAIETARRLGVAVHVTEHGYFRPDWVTLEREGVNANTRLPRDPDWYLQEMKRTPRSAPLPLGRNMPWATFWIARYHLALYAGHPAFWRFRPGYRRSAALQAAGHACRYVLHGALTHSHAERRRRLMRREGPLFLALLQRPGDSQLWRHSAFETTAEFLAKVVSSFAAHAPADAALMVRPHPLDPGLDPHEKTLRGFAELHGVGDRVAFVDDGKLHEILPHIAGAVCVNSTAGLAAVEFGKPCAVLGKAMYDIPGLTHQGGLDSFWSAPEAPSPELYEAFRQVVIARTQVNGAFATRRGRAMAVAEMAERLVGNGPARILAQ